MRRQRAVITVFFCLLSVVFLGFAFTIVEAVRFAGARAQCANVTSLGLWSVFSEYENVLMEDYGLYAVEASYGGELVSREKMQEKLSSYTKENEHVTPELSGALPGLLLDPWKISSGDIQIDQYALLTDRGGEYYYQQAVEYMQKTAWADSIGTLQDVYKDAQRMKQAESEYENSRKESSDSMKGVSSAAEDAKRELTTVTTKDSKGNAVVTVDQNALQAVNKAQQEGQKKNPLDNIEQMKSGDILKLVCGKIKLSKKEISGSELPSKRRGNKGVLSLDTPRGGVVDNMLFREYLLDHFRNFKEGGGDERLVYQMEYLIGGKYSDKANLKKTVRSLVFLRESSNYMFLVGNLKSNKEATALATAIIGWTGKPVLVAAIKHALLLAWAYGESLYDVRILLHGGRIPLKKTEADWHVPLSSLMTLKKVLPKADKTAAGGTYGLQYEDYLRLLVSMTGMTHLKKRSLDLIELNMRSVCGCPSFRADNCVIGMTVKTTWNIPSVFGKVPAALLGTGDLSANVKVDGGFAYR